MTQKIKLLFFLLSFSIALFKLSAQPFQATTSNYVEGVIYLKIKNSSNVQISYPPPPNASNDSLYETLEKYGTINVIRPYLLFATPSFDRCYKIYFTETSKILNFIDALDVISSVEFVEQVPKMELFTTTPDDATFGSWQLGAIDAYNAFDLHTGGNAVVAIVDDAVLVSHEDLAANIVSQRDVADGDNDANPPLTGTNAATPDVFSHGTHVAGIAGAVTNNGIGVASIGWNNNIMAVKATEDNTNEVRTITHGFEGVEWAAVNGADVINLSWGGAAFSEMDFMVIQQARQIGVIIVAAAGNNSNGIPNYPAAYGESTTNQAWEAVDHHLVIAVASIDANGERSLWGIGGLGAAIGSNFGSWIDVSAYGTEILSTVAGSSGGNPINNLYGTKTGTSMAAPLVAGLAGLMISYNANATSEQIIDCLLNTANDDIYSPTHPGNISVTMGSGRIDAFAALRCLAMDCNDNPIAVIQSTSSHICPGGTVQLSANQGISYLWSTNETVQTIVINQTGTYSVTVTFPGNCTDTDEITVSDADDLQIIISENSGHTPNDGLLCGTHSAALLAYSGSTYSWNVFNSTSAGISNIMADINLLPFTFTFTVTVTDAGGCPGLTQVESATLTWFPNPEPTLTVEEDSGTPDDGIICPGEEVTLQVAQGGGFAYEWSTGAHTSQITVAPTSNTTYTVTVTNENGCTLVETVNILVVGITGSIWVEEYTGGWADGVIECGDEAILHPSGGTDYIWSTGDTDQNITVHPTTTTTYTVTISNGKACETVLEVTVTVECVPLNADFDEEIDCRMLSLTSMLNGPCTVHSWDFGDGTDISTDASPDHTYGGSGTYTVTHTVSNECTSVLVAHQIVIDCDPPGSFTCGCPPGANSYNVGIPNTTTLLSDSGLPLNTIISNACIAIHGELLVDDGTTNLISLAIEASEIRMQPGASIRVGYKNTLNIRGGSIRGCPDESMWRSIILEDRSILQLRNLDIEDAQHAVTLSYKSSVTLASNHFAKNYISVYSPPAPLTPIAGLAFTCIGNEFDCENQILHPAFDDQDIVFQPGAQSWAGIALNDITTPLNVGSFQIGNTFHDMGNGIVLNNVPMGVYNATFSDITRSTLHPITLGTGTAVQSTGDGHPLIVQGVAPQPDVFPVTPNFVRCGMGVSTRGIPATITNNRMQQMGSGIRMDTPGEASLIVHDNIIGCDNIGVQAFQCAESNVLSIKRNQITVDQGLPPASLLRGTAIFLSDQELSHQTSIVEDNEIWLWGQNLGISLNGSRTVRVSENTVHFQNSSLNIAGIDLLNAGDLDVRCNDVIGINQYQGTGNANIALRVNNCDDIQYGDNNFNNTRIGARFENACMNTFLRGNHFTAHQNGVLLRSTLSFMNNQIHAGNQFLSITAPDRGAVSEFGPTTQFFVHTTAAPFWPQNPLPSSGLIIFDPLGSPWTPGLNFCQLTADPLDGKTDKDIEVAKGEAEGAGALTWMTEKQLYRKLRNHPDLLGEVAELEDFKNYYESASLGLVDAVEEKTTQMMNPDTVLSSTLLYRETEMHTYLADMQKIESEYLDDPDYEYLDALNDYKSSVSTLGDSLMDLVKQSRGEVTAYRSPLLTQAMAQNTTVGVSATWINNEKIVNAIYLQTVAQGISMSAAQLSTLASIASQCPETGGNAVFKARSLYAGTDWKAFYEADNACAGNNLQEESEERSQTITPLMTRIFPNPAHDLLYVQLHLPEGFEGSVVLRDMLGRRLYIATVDGLTGAVTIPLATQINGLVICTIESAAGSILERHKVAIQH